MYAKNIKYLIIYFFMLILENNIYSACAASTNEIFVPAGIYFKQANLQNKPISVYIDDFYIDMFPVSIAEYALCIKNGVCTDAPLRRFMKNNKQGYQKTYDEALETALNDQEKMTLFTFNEADLYCKSQDKRLPTLAEWGKTARGENNSKYYWGEYPPDCSNANWKECHGADANARNINFKACPYGTYGMFSGFSEMTLDIYHQDFEHTRFTRNPLCTIEMYNNYPQKKESLIMSRLGVGRVTSLPTGKLYISIDGGIRITENADYEDDISFRCVRSKLMNPEDFNK